MRRAALATNMASLDRFTGSTKEQLIRLLAIPVFNGLLFGWTSTAGGHGSYLAGTILWVVLSVSSWLAVHCTTTMAAPICRSYGQPLWLALALGLMGSGILTIPLNLAMGDAFRMWGFERQGLETLGDYTLLRAVNATVAPLLMWVGINLALHRHMGMAMYGYDAPSNPDRAHDAASHPTASSTAPRFFVKLKPALRGRVLAVQAELHYIRVHTEFGSDLILYRFSDAVEELSKHPGTQIHRSWWVRSEAIQSRSGNQLTLTNRLIVPIGRGFRTNLATIFGF